jgi:hypothetical protein
VKNDESLTDSYNVIIINFFHARVRSQLLIGVADLRYERLNMPVRETSIDKAWEFSTYFFHTLIKQRKIVGYDKQSILIFYEDTIATTEGFSQTFLGCDRPLGKSVKLINFNPFSLLTLRLLTVMILTTGDRNFDLCHSVN